MKKSEHKNHRLQIKAKLNNNNDNNVKLCIIIKNKLFTIQNFYNCSHDTSILNKYYTATYNIGTEE